MLDRLSGDELQQLIDSFGAPVYLVEVGRDGAFRYLRGNALLEQATGLKPEQYVGRRPDEVFPGELGARANARYAQCVRTKASVEGEDHVPLPGGWRWWRIVQRPVLDAGGRVVRIFVAATDITEHKRAQAQLDFHHLLLQVQQDLTPDAILVSDEEGNYLSWNRRFLQMWGVDDDLMRQGRDVVLPRLLPLLCEPEAFVQRLRAAFADLRGAIDGEELQLKDGRTVVLYSRGLVDQSQIRRGRVWYLRDVTQRKQAERRLRESQQLQQAILDSASQAIITVDSQRIVRSFNPAAERLLGYRADEVVGKVQPFIFHDPQEVEQRRRELSDSLGREVSVDEVFHGGLRSSRTVVQHWHYVRKDGRRVPVELSLTLLCDSEGEPAGFLGVASDISERIAHEQRLRELARTDGLTGLWNRRHFSEMALQLHHHAAREREPLTLVLLDIDYFKRLNDTFGHAAGDAALKAVAEVLPRCLRTSDLWCRWGGEEFALVLVNSDDDEALVVAERIRRAIEDLKVTHEDRVLRLTASLGLSAWRRDEATLDRGMQRADAALYEAKRLGRNRVERA